MLIGLGAYAGAATGTYQVRWGDTLWGIAARLHVPVPALASANGIKNANQLVAGRQLKVPPPSPLPTKLLADPQRLALRPLFDKWAKAYGVPSDLFQAMTWYESGWQNNKVSSTGARGIGQLMPDTVALTQRLIGKKLNVAVPSDNIQMSARFLALLLKETNNKADQALAGYYQGLRSLHAVGMYDDTKHYVAGILALRKSFVH
ncbi:MAG: transglycosylase SLT domain-containing protein [Actinobacteria bacterium]|nr:transglycosylase SLT domain-containing protein [Actinomycetota bacterium]MBV9936193.1 transglycosylase SLT domain-containing protein [Actinomycetota bacterium]